MLHARPIFNYLPNYSLNCIPLSLITITNHLSHDNNNNKKIVMCHDDEQNIFTKLNSALLIRNRRRRAKALLDFERHDDDELGFRKNDIVTVRKQHAILSTTNLSYRHYFTKFQITYALCYGQLLRVPKIKIQEKSQISFILSPLFVVDITRAVIGHFWGIIVYCPTKKRAIIVVFLSKLQPLQKNIPRVPVSAYNRRNVWS